MVGTQIVQISRTNADGFWIDLRSERSDPKSESSKSGFLPIEFRGWESAKMRQSIPLVAVLLLFYGDMAAASSKSSAEREILATDDARIAAAKSSDASALERIYADEFRLITHTGLVRTKRDQVQDYRTGVLRYASFELLERDVKTFGTVGIVWSRERSAILLPGGQDVGGDRRITRVYVHRRGRWQLLSSHASAAQ